MKIENKQEWKICKNNLSEENPCGICFSDSFGKTVFHKCANGVNHVFHKACMKTWYDAHTSSRTCPICKEEVSIGDLNLKGRYQDLAEKFEKWNYPQTVQVEDLIEGFNKKGFAIAFAALGVVAAVEALEILKGRLFMEITGTEREIAELTTTGTVLAASAAAGVLVIKNVVLGFGPGVKQGRGKIATATAALGALGAAGALTTGLFLRDEVVENLAGAAAVVAGGAGVAAGVAGVVAGVAGVVAGVAGAELTGRATENFTRRIVRWMKE